MNAKGMLLCVVVAVGLAISGCGGSSSDGSSADSSDGSSGGASSGMERDARNAAMAEVQKHWTKAPDGWITARQEGSNFAPIKFVRQMREISIERVEPAELSDADHMNGFEWAGDVTFKRAPCREAGEPGILLDGMSNLGIGVSRQRGRWSQWADFRPEPMKVQKVNGQWQIHQDTWMLHGTIPTPNDLADAGVK